MPFFVDLAVGDRWSCLVVRSVTKSGLKTKYFMFWFWFTELVEVLQQTGIIDLPKSTIPLSGKFANLPLSGKFADVPLSIYDTLSGRFANLPLSLSTTDT